MQCCEKTSTGKENTCCGGGCCEDAQTCCSDDKGASCCMQQSTFCVAKTGTSQLPARCCPRWTVGCNTGSVGCCDPAQPWQWNIASSARHASAAGLNTAAASASEILVDANDVMPPRAGGATEAYALIISGWATGRSSLVALTIDTTTGKVTKKIPVRSFRDDPAGDETREFVWDSAKKIFYYLDANFTAAGGARPPKGREAYLFSVDPTTGATTQQTVTGAVDFPTGYAFYPEKGTILMATDAVFSNGTENAGFNFYSVNTGTAVATPLGTVARGGGEASPAYYAGYHREVSADGNLFYRLGYKMVTEQSEQGVSITTVAGSAGSQGSTSWKDELSQGHDYFMTMHRYQNSTGGRWGFLSLAPSLAIGKKRGLDLVGWSLDEAVEYRTVASFGNAHVPSTPNVGALGYLADAVKDGFYAALVVQSGSAPQGLGDRWALVTVDLATGKSANLALTPRDVADTWSISGLGL